MKKTIALFAALLMLLSIFPVAFAQDAESVADNVSADTSAVSDAADSGQAEVTAVAVTNETTETAEDTTTDTTDETTEASDDAALEVTDADTEDAGVTPDSPILWGLDRAMERISLALTFNKAAKAKKGLAYANERLSEIKLMAKENKPDAVEKAAEAQEEDLADAEEAASEISESTPEEELTQQIEIQNQFQEQQAHMEQVKNAILDRMKSVWSPEKYDKISAVFAKIEAKHASLNQSMEDRQEKTKTKIQAKTGKSAEEVDEIGEQIKAQVHVKTQNKKETGKPVKVIANEASTDSESEANASDSTDESGSQEGLDDSGNDNESEQEGTNETSEEGEDGVDIEGVVSIGKAKGKAVAED